MKIHRHLVLRVVEALTQIFSEGLYADKVIEKTLKNEPRWGSRDRRFFAEGVYECVRWRKQLAFLAEKEDDGSEDFWMRAWSVWAFEQGMLDVPADWGINEKRIRERQLLLEEKAPRAVRESIPDWLDELGKQELGNRWPAVLTALNKKAPVDLRTNTLKCKREKLQGLMLKAEIETQTIENVPDGLTLPLRKNVFKTQPFQDGFFEVQDRASQLVAPLLDPQPGERVIDACAGAGGKTLHIAALMKNKGKIISMDIHEWKLGELRKRASRAGANIVETRLIDTTKVIKRLADSADRVLLDVPCSGIGVLRRNPDSKWKLSLEEMQRLRTLQSEILQSHSRMVKPGGVLVYATCSFLHSENIKQVEKFLSENIGKWELVDSISVMPDEGRGDGFFAAKLRRQD